MSGGGQGLCRSVGLRRAGLVSDGCGKDIKIKRSNVSKAYLVANGRNLGLGDMWIIVNNVRQGAAFHKLHDNP